MERKIIQGNKKTLLDLRHEGKKQALSINAMQAHGKIMGMDTFSWVNPNMDQLSSALASFPFRIIWISTQQQLRKCLAIEENLSEKIETVILHDNTMIDLSEDDFFTIKKSIAVQTPKEALQLLSVVKKEKCAFLFSTEGNNAQKDKEEFEKFIARYR